MNKHPYNNKVERKPDQLPPADVDHLWRDMYVILDKEMPQKKERRRFFAWFLSTEGLVLLFATLIAGSSLYFLYKKESEIVTGENVAHSSLSKKFVVQPASEISSQKWVNLVARNKSVQDRRAQISGTTSSITGVDDKIRL